MLCAPSSWIKWVERKGLARTRVGRYFRDEFHLEANKDTLWIKYLEELNEGDNSWPIPFDWVASGTPVDDGPRNLKGVMQLLLRGLDLKDNSFWVRYTPEGLDKLHCELGAYLKRSDDEDDNRTDKAAIWRWVALLSNIMIQRGPETKWKGEPIIHLPRLRYRVVDCELTQHMKRLADQAYRDDDPKYQGLTSATLIPAPCVLAASIATRPTILDALMMPENEVCVGHDARRCSLVQ